MHNSQDLQQVLSLRQALIEGDEKRVKQQHDAGKQTARQRVEKLLDAGSFAELFALVMDGDSGAGVLTGYGTVSQRPVYVVAQDFTVHGGAMGKAQAQKIVKLLDMAQKNGAPVVTLCDSAGVRLDEGAQALSAYSEIYAKMARMSGVCPMLAVVLGPCVGGAALLAQLADVCIMAESAAEMRRGAPQVLSTMSGKALTAKQLGGAEEMMKQGACALAAADEDGALAMVKQVLDLLPSCNAEGTDVLESDDINRLLPALDAADAEVMMNALLDAGTMLELYAGYEPSVRVAMGRMGGHSVGIVATEGKHLTAGALTKAARFVRFMDCYSLPVISLVNTQGVNVTSVEEQAELMKAQSRLLYAFAEATCPKLCVVTGDAIGQAYVAMGGTANADVTYAWPGATISALTPEAAVAVLYGDKVAEDKELSVEAARAKYADEYIAEVAGAINAAKAGLIDDVIEPAQTRMLLISALEMLASKRDSNPPKKHGNLPL